MLALRFPRRSGCRWWLGGESVMNTFTVSLVVRRDYMVLFAALFLPFALPARLIAVGLADDTKSQPAKETNFSKLIEELVSPNMPPVTQNRAGGNVRFPAGYDVAAQRRIDEVRQTLQDRFEESLPFLIAALDDERYCLTISWADGDGFYNESVGAVCRNIIESQLEVYRDKIVFSGPRHWHKYDYKQISREWWQARRERKLFELQIEAVEWAIQQFEKSDDSDPRFDRVKQRSDLRSLRDKIAKTQKPVQPRPMLRMVTRDVGTIRSIPKSPN